MKTDRIKAALIGGRRHLWSGVGELTRSTHSTWICHAIDLAVHYGEITGRDAAEAKKLIDTRITPALTLVGVMSNQFPTRKDFTFVEIQQFRLEWLNALIEEFAE